MPMPASVSRRRGIGHRTKIREETAGARYRSRDRPRGLRAASNDARRLRPARPFSRARPYR
ncbi:hypothetical protein C7S14_5350 [Burkholderia cepacia]|nr:hypothetical protein [Burkholderia cepacia]QOH32705.1 hypothetical protein C7S14_5350 [Burkholderia cepacia]